METKKQTLGNIIEIAEQRVAAPDDGDARVVYRNANNDGYGICMLDDFEDLSILCDGLAIVWECGQIEWLN